MIEVSQAVQANKMITRKNKVCFMLMSRTCPEGIVLNVRACDVAGIGAKMNDPDSYREE